MLTFLLVENFFLLGFLCFSIVLSMALLFISFLFTKKEYDEDKLTVYECGVEPFGELRASFDVRFFLIAVAFLIFDLEIAFLYPWAVGVHLVSHYLGFSYFFPVYLFLILLLIGYLFEIISGALDWGLKT